LPKKIRVALLFGGRSAEHEVSLASAAAIFKHFDRAKFDVRSIYITREGFWKPVESPSVDRKTLAHGKPFSFLPWAVRRLPPRLEADIYFPILHGPFGEDGTIQGLLEMAGVPFAGAGVLGSALGMDKASTKSILHERGLPTVPYLILAEREWRESRRAVLGRIRANFGLPLFVKPSNLGSSVGITKVKESGAIFSALETAFRYDTKILVEKGIRGKEIECSVLGNDEPEASLPGEVIPFREFYDYEDKYIEGKTTFVIPVRLPRPTTEKIRRLAVAAFKALNVSGLARVDFFLEDGSHRLYINELNTIPGFTEISMFPKLWEASGLPFPRLLERLIKLGFERHRDRKACVQRRHG
jgi:D-alanine-D-alanine ligase